MNNVIKVAEHLGRDIFYGETGDTQNGDVRFFVKGADGNPAFERRSIAAVKQALNERAVAAMSHKKKEPAFERVEVFEKSYSCGVRKGVLTSADLQDGTGWVLWSGGTKERSKEPLSDLRILNVDNLAALKRRKELEARATKLDREAERVWAKTLRADKFLRQRKAGR